MNQPTPRVAAGKNPLDVCYFDHFFDADNESMPHRPTEKRMPRLEKSFTLQYYQ
jgi:hypothetical protein